MRCEKDRISEDTATEICAKCYRVPLNYKNTSARLAAAGDPREIGCSRFSSTSSNNEPNSELFEVVVCYRAQRRRARRAASLPIMNFIVIVSKCCVRPLSLFYSDASADGVEERSVVSRSRSHAQLRRDATMNHAFQCVQLAFIDL
ncbi:hypothetical protein EVAR_58504_1 [Eumeta japonica]|uniref:Uncharacterized protein n=1 Tax=Eumeta variegata TaxID=151549 RepID=A0A4C1Z9Q5_EUMVA|nr:hypothetical protein EVAR_58504_1 [Eumeta japonica]